MIHQGEIVEKVVRRSGYSLSKLASRLQLSRATLYNKFKRAELSYRFIIRVGNVLHYDFTQDFPEMKQEIHLVEESNLSKVHKKTETEIKYRNLLEKHIHLLQLLLRIAHENGLYSLKQSIIQLMEEEPVNKSE